MAKKDKDEEQGKDDADNELSFDDDEEFEDRLSFDDDEDEEDEEDEEIDDEPSFDEAEEEEEDVDEDYDDDYDDDFEDEDDDFGAEDGAEADPFWWTPHAVLVGLLMIGVLGAFGFFNEALGFLAATSPDQNAGHGDSHGDVTGHVPVKKAEPSKSHRKLSASKAKPPSGDVFGAKHLLVQYKGSKRAGAQISRSKEEAKKRAAEAAGKGSALSKANPKLADLSKKFSELVGEYSDEPGAKSRGGDLGRFRKGSMVPPFQAAVEKLDRGAISGVVETPFGYHVILRTF